MKELFSYIKSFNLKALFIEPTLNGVIEAFRYLFVGGISFLVDWGSLYILTVCGMHYLVATIIAFILGLVVNYLLSKAFVFKAESTRAGKAAEFAVYTLIGVIGLGITEGLMYIGVELLGMWTMLVKIIAAAIVLVWNYALRKIVLYRKGK